MKVSDYIMRFIARLGVGHVFYVSGGGAMHLNDSLGHTGGLTGVAMLHEQGASIAAEAYARIKNGYGVCLVTSGPGATNALTGLVGAYIDSSPVIYISGQVKRDDLRKNAFAGRNVPEGMELRQFGIQEVDILPMVRAYTKYAVQIDDPANVRYEMEKAAALATHGRPGPVWLDVPLDVQAFDVEPEHQQGFDASTLPTYEVKENDVEETLRRFNQAKRPLLILGHGVRLAHAEKEARELLETLGVPVMTSWNGLDLIEDDHPLFFGRPGIVANRAANIIQQHADFVLTIGTRLCLLNTGYNFDGFLQDAFHVMVDIDPAELSKKNLHPNLAVCADAGGFIRKLLDAKGQISARDDSGWLAHCRGLMEKYPRFIPEQLAREGFVSNYHLIDEISRQMTSDDIYQFTSSGTTVDIAMKTFRLKRGQRAFLTKGLAAMGYDIPSCIGSCIASNGRRTACVTGDGSAAMNMQEMEVIRRLNLPIKLFISDNQGYAMIYGSQTGNFQRKTGCDKESGLTLPNLARVAEAFGIRAMNIENEARLSEQIAEALAGDDPVVCRVNTDITQPILPKQANYMKEDGQMASRPLDDMAPLLPREEYEELKRDWDT